MKSRQKDYLIYNFLLVFLFSAIHICIEIFHFELFRQIINNLLLPEKCWKKISIFFFSFFLCCCSRNYIKIRYSSKNFRNSRILELKYGEKKKRVRCMDMASLQSLILVLVLGMLAARLPGTNAKVLEMDDRLIELTTQGKWLVVVRLASDEYLIILCYHWNFYELVLCTMVWTLSQVRADHGRCCRQLKGQEFINHRQSWCNPLQQGSWSLRNQSLSNHQIVSLHSI